MRRRRTVRTPIRTTLALVSAAVTSMVAIAFLLPLAVIVRDVARDQALTSARLAGASIEPVLAVTTARPALDRAILSTAAGAAGRIAVYLTASGTAASGTAPSGTLAGGPQHASAADLRAAAAGRSFIAPVAGGYVVLQPVALGGGRLAVTEVYVPAGQADQGVTASWAVMTAVALALIGVSVIVSDRLATRVTRPARELAIAAAALGGGDLSARSPLTGPAELAAAGQAFNLMAERLSAMIAAERDMAADLPHRLRTPLTALRMSAAGLGPGRAARDTRAAIDRLEHEVDLIIRAARRPARGEPPGCDAAEVLRERMAFWSALAEDQGRPWRLAGADTAVPVPVPRSDLAAAIDALAGNVLRHTAEGTGFSVALQRDEGSVTVTVCDAGPGIADPAAAVRRGSSGSGSTGLGLDIARRVAEATGGGLRIAAAALGGAQVQLRLRTWTPPPSCRAAGSGRGRRLIRSLSVH
jgi:signal transduction histidine kinase